MEFGHEKVLAWLVSSFVFPFFNFPLSVCLGELVIVAWARQGEMDSAVFDRRMTGLDISLF